MSILHQVRALPATELRVAEIFTSLQGESSFVGLPCVFVRLAGCDLNCAWCDTAEARSGGISMARAAVLHRALAGPGLVEVTGGEPLLQAGTPPLLQELCDAGRTVLLETSGAHDWSGIDDRVHKIVDLKAPSSGESHRNRLQNLPSLTSRDELKFVLADRQDYEWLRLIIQEHSLAKLPCSLLVSVVWGRLALPDLARWVLQDRLQVRVQVQLHKVIWGQGAHGV